VLEDVAAKHEVKCSVREGQVGQVGLDRRARIVQVDARVVRPGERAQARLQAVLRRDVQDAQAGAAGDALFAQVPPQQPLARQRAATRAQHGPARPLLREAAEPATAQPAFDAGTRIPDS